MEKTRHRSGFVLAIIVLPGAGVVFRGQLMDFLSQNFALSVLMALATGFVAAICFSKGKLILPWLFVFVGSIVLTYTYLCDQYFMEWHGADSSRTSLMKALVQTPVSWLVLNLQPKGDNLFDLDLGIRYTRCVITAAASVVSIVLGWVFGATTKTRNTRIAKP